MGNPLAHFFAVEEREDGVFVTVTPEEKPRTSIETIKRALNSALVMNYDMALLEQVIERASGEPELIGPPFEYYDPGFDKYVDVTITPQRASVKINSLCLADSLKPTTEMLLLCLKRKGVRYGINTKKVTEYIESGKFDIDIPVAFAKAPVDGKDGEIEFEIDLKTDLKPQEKKDGSVDYRNIRSFVQVGKNQVIAKKSPPTPGEDGISVTGGKIPAQPGNDIAFPAGTNVHVSDDGTQLVASRSGVLKREGNLINVTDELAIGKNVDYSVGNVKHAGDIVIGGDVMPGFTVEAEGNITVKGQIEAARIISRNGTITVQRGILGKGECYIYGKAGIHTVFAQEAILETEGVLTIERSCLHCTCSCGILRALDHQASVVGGSLRAAKHIEVHQIGTEKLIETRIGLYDKNRIEAEEKLKEILELKKSLEEKLEPVKKQVRTKAAILKKTGAHTTDRQRKEIKKWVDIYNNLTLKLKYIDKRAGEIRKKTHIQSRYDGYIRVTGHIYGGSILDLYGMTKRIDNRITDKTFRVRESRIQISGSSV
ncbi:MAG: DUF342 domain-containing protein [Chitinivibrionales bacterium]|nr:DUF342 domain-containing protein [Chitinivibrionales bacterium]